MKKVLLSAAIVSALAMAGAAQERPQSPPAPSTRSQSPAPATLHGSVTSVDNASKSFVLKDDASGKDTTVYWDGTTRMNGDLKVGSAVTVLATDSDGRTLATTIDIKSAKKPY